jgi:phage repressor protein C with HTH and peptisase S24 domain
MNEIINKEFFKNMFIVECDNMKPYLKKGDVAIYEDIRPNRRLGSSVYILEVNNQRFVSRVQFLASGGIRLIYDDSKVYEEFKRDERHQVIFIRHVIGRIIKDYSIYEF